MNVDRQIHQYEEENFDKTILGFWVYLMTDCVLFGTFFATYIVLHRATFGGPTSREIFSLPYILIETFALLTSSFTCGVVGQTAKKEQKGASIFWFVLTFLLGLVFVVMEAHEFYELIKEGNSWSRSAFLSAYFTLVGAHGTHVSFGLLWMFVMMIQIAIKGFSITIHRRIMCLRLFWHFLDVVWIFIFTFVYLFGVL